MAHGAENVCIGGFLTAAVYAVNLHRKVGEASIMNSIPLSPINDVFDYIKDGPMPIKIVIMGTIWSPPCRYSWKMLQDMCKLPEYADVVKPFFVDQDKDIQYCNLENIPIGFPTTIVFVEKNIIHFTFSGQDQSTNKRERKTRLVRQLNNKLAKSILDQAKSVQRQESKFITITSQD